MRRLLSCASLCACILVVTCIAMWKRGSTATDWLRVNLGERSAIFASSGQHVGAALVADPTSWTMRDGRRVKYKHFKQTDLRDQFPSNLAGFAYTGQTGAHLVLVPMWFIALLGVAPPLLWLSQKRSAKTVRA